MQYLTSPPEKKGVSCILPLQSSVVKRPNSSKDRVFLKTHLFTQGNFSYSSENWRCINGVNSRVISLYFLFVVYSFMAGSQQHYLATFSYVVKLSYINFLPFILFAYLLISNNKKITIVSYKGEQLKKKKYRNNYNTYKISNFQAPPCWMGALSSCIFLYAMGRLFVLWTEHYL